MHRRNTMAGIGSSPCRALALTLLVPSAAGGRRPASGARPVSLPHAGDATDRGRRDHGARSGSTHRASRADAWRIRIWDNGDAVFSSVRRTNAAGDLNVVTAIENLHGRDELVGKARDVSSGSVCDVAG